MLHVLLKIYILLLIIWHIFYWEVTVSIEMENHHSIEYISWMLHIIKIMVFEIFFILFIIIRYMCIVCDLIFDLSNPKHFWCMTPTYTCSLILCHLHFCWFLSQFQWSLHKTYHHCDCSHFSDHDKTWSQQIMHTFLAQ